MNMLKFAPLLLLTACASTPEVTLQPPQEVKVIVSVPCKIKLVEKPVWPLDVMQPNSDIYTQAKTMLAELEARIAYEIELEAAVKTCQ